MAAPEMMLRVTGADQSARDYLAKMPDGAHTYLRDAEAGRATLYALDVDGECVGAVELRVDAHCATGQRDLVVVALSVDTLGIRGLRQVNRLLEKVAGAHRCDVIRFHTPHKFLMLLALRNGYRRSYVLERAVNVQ